MGRKALLKSLVRFVGVLVGTAAVGLLLGFSLSVALSRLLADQLTGWGGLIGGLAGLALGYPLGIIIALIVLRKLLHYPGSFWLGALGAVVGAWMPLGLALAAPDLLGPNLVWMLFYTLDPVLGTVGYHVRRKNT